MQIKKNVTYETTLPTGETITAGSEEELKALYKKKTTIDEQDATISFPVILQAEDYHEFTMFKELLEKLTDKVVSFREFEDDVATYCAVYWIGEAEPVEKTRQIIRDFNENGA